MVVFHWPELHPWIRPTRPYHAQMDQHLFPHLFNPTVTEIGRLAMTPPLQATAGRTVVSLDGSWEFKLVSSVAEVEPDWFEATDGWRSIAVPGSWTRQDTGDLPTTQT